jgi:hypothetical protein
MRADKSVVLALVASALSALAGGAQDAKGVEVTPYAASQSAS